MAKKRKAVGRSGTKKLKLKRETIKDLDANNAKRVRGGMLFLSGKGCGVTGGCIQDVKMKEVTVTCAKACL